MGFFGWAIVAGLLALWFWWMERRHGAAIQRLAAKEPVRAPATDDDDDDDDDDYEQRRRRRLRLAQLPLHALAVVFGLAALVFLVLSFFRTVPTGTAAVPVTFGSAGKQVGPGLHVEWPITKMKNISVRTQSYTMAPTGDDPSVQVLGEDATGATADATLLFRVQKKKATDLYENIGGSYATTVVRPSARTCIRAAFAQFPLVQAATTEFGQVERNSDQCIRRKLAGTGVGVLDFQLRELRLSAQVTNAINGKIAAETVGAKSALDPAYLQFLYIQAIQQIGSSKNSSTLVIPSPSNGLGLNITPPSPSTSAPSTTTTPGG
jgi:hypothetical protein